MPDSLKKVREAYCLWIENPLVPVSRCLCLLYFLTVQSRVLIFQTIRKIYHFISSSDPPGELIE